MKIFESRKSGGIRVLEALDGITKSDPRNGILEVKVIQPGQGSSGFYPKEMLERDGPTAFPAGLQMYEDHPSLSQETEQPERRIREVWGQLATNSRFIESHPDGPGLYAFAEIPFDVKDFLEARRNMIGVSIRALGEAEPQMVGGVEKLVVTTLSEGISVDFVTQAGAGGKISNIIEAAKRNIIEAAKRGKTSADAEQHQKQESTMEKDYKTLYESALKRAEQLEAERNAALLKISEAEKSRLIEKALQAADLAELCKSRIQKAFESKTADFSDGWRGALATELEAAIKEESEYYQKIAESFQAGSSVPESAALGESATTESATGSSDLAQLIEAESMEKSLELFGASKKVREALKPKQTH